MRVFAFHVLVPTFQSKALNNLFCGRYYPIRYFVSSVDTTKEARRVIRKRIDNDLGCLPSFSLVGSRGQQFG